MAPVWSSGLRAGSRLYLSEDFTFCYRFRKIGGKVWLDTENRLRPRGSMEFFGHPVIQMIKCGAKPYASANEPVAAE
jgi:hypothetical protein